MGLFDLSRASNGGVNPRIFVNLLDFAMKNIPLPNSVV
jgi:hypothetical protein